MAKAHLALAAAVGFLLAFGIASPTTHAAQNAPPDAGYTITIDRQADDAPPTGEEDTTVWVQTYTVLAAGIACAVFLLLFLMRIALGRGPIAPEPQEEFAHH